MDWEEIGNRTPEEEEGEQEVMAIAMVDGWCEQKEKEEDEGGLAGRSGTAQARTREEKRRADFGGVLESDRA